MPFSEQIRYDVIDVIYNPPTVSGGEASPCLEVGESKTIGYGNKGDAPWSFVLEEAGWTSELTYLKLFYSTGYIDLLHIRRDALFLPTHEHQYHREAKGRGLRKDGPHFYTPAGPPSQRIGSLKVPLVVVNGSE